jgi:hypothetical protein
MKGLSPLGLGASASELESSFDLVQPKINTPEIALARYRAIPNTTARKIAWVGDSTTTQMFSGSVGGYATIIGGAAGTDYTASLLSAPGQPYYNVTNGNFGSNGNTLSNWLATPANITAIQAFNPDLIIFCYGGINDVRLGATTQAQLQTMFDSAITALQAALPNVPIIFRGANSLVYDSANNPAYIDAPNSLAKVQGYTDIMRNACRYMIGRYSGVYVIDHQGGDPQPHYSDFRPKHPILFKLRCPILIPEQRSSLPVTREMPCPDFPHLVPPKA